MCQVVEELSGGGLGGCLVVLCTYSTKNKSQYTPLVALDVNVLAQLEWCLASSSTRIELTILRLRKRGQSCTTSTSTVSTTKIGSSTVCRAC
jgi:hypothetical protein